MLDFKGMLPILFNKMTMALLDKSIDLKTSVDKSLADLKASVDQVNANVASLTTQFQDFDTCLDVEEVKVDEILPNMDLNLQLNS